MDSTLPLSEREIQRLIYSTNSSTSLEVARRSKYTCYGCKRKNCTMSMSDAGCELKTLIEEKEGKEKPALIDRKHKIKHFRKRHNYFHYR